MIWRKRLGSNDEILAQKISHLEHFDKIYYLERIRKLKKTWIKCTGLKKTALRNKTFIFEDTISNSKNHRQNLEPFDFRLSEFEMF